MQTSLTIPYKEILNIVTLVQATFFSCVLLTPRFNKNRSNQILLVTLLIFATVKFDQIFQLMGGLEAYPQYGFVFVPIQWLLTPSLYLFIKARVTKNFHFDRKQLIHVIPAFFVFIYFYFSYYQFSTNQKLLLIQSGAFTNILHSLIIPVVSDCIQLGYLWMAYSTLRSYGFQLKRWFARVDNVDYSGLNYVIFLWAVVFIFHLLIIIFVNLKLEMWIIFIIYQSLNTLHFLIVNVLSITAFVTFIESPVAFSPPVPQEKYLHSQQTANERQTLFHRTQKELLRNKQYLDPNISLSILADIMIVTPRDLSEAINSESDMNFYSFINALRIKEAQHLLKSNLDMLVLDIAFKVGFNSKSPFNSLFKSTTGMTPSKYRQELKKNYSK